MVELRFLGPMEVWSRDRRVAVGGAKPRRVLAALAAQPGQMINIDRLVDAVWEDEPPPTARKQIQNAVSALRGTEVGDVLVARGPGYLLDVTRDKVDVSRFEDFLLAADGADSAGDIPRVAEALRAGLSLWRGSAFDGVGGRHAEAMAVRLQELRWTALTRWAEAALRLGRHGSVVSELTAIELPVREPLTGSLMLGLYRSGRGAEAIARYHQLREHLADGLGVEPGQELRQLFEQILGEDPALAHQPVKPDRPNFLPRDVVGFVGRTDEVARLTGTAAEGGAVVIHAVDGMAGVGKTALAVHAAHELAARFEDGQLFVDLRGHAEQRDPMSSDEALAMLLRCVGVADARIPPDADHKAALWRAESARQRLLVVLDNAFSTAQVKPLLPGSSQCAVLITSRRRLVGLDGVHVISLDPLPPADAVAMFTRIVGSARTADEPELVDRAVRLCGFLPLAIGISAARFRSRPSWTLSYLVARLADEHGRAGLLQADDYGVAAAFSLSYRHLSAEQQRVYRLLGLHPGTELDKYHAAALAALPADRTEQILDDLCDAHLLIASEPGRYRLHDLIRQHARAAAYADEPETQRAQALHRLLDYYLHVSEEASNLISPWRRQLGPAPLRTPADAPKLGSLAESLAWYQAEYANLDPVVRLAAEHSDAQHGWQIPKNAGAYLLRSGHLSLGITVLRSALAATERPGTDPRARAACLANLSIMLRDCGDYLGAAECVRQSMEHARSVGDREGEISLLTSIADLNVWTGDYREVLDVTERAIEIFRGEGNWLREASALASRIEALVQLGRQKEAITEAHRASRSLDDLPSDRVAAVLLSRLATAYSRNEEHETALDMITRAMKAARDGQDRVTEAGCQRRLAQVLYRAGYPDEARRNALAALDLLADSPSSFEVVEVRNLLGAIQFCQAEYEQALAHFRDAAAITGDGGYRYGLACAFDGIGAVMERLGDAEGGRQYQDRAHSVFAELGVPT